MLVVEALHLEAEDSILVAEAEQVVVDMEDPETSPHNHSHLVEDHNAKSASNMDTWLESVIIVLILTSNHLR